ncbi:MAG: hypothetical protein M3405_01300 [Acidobacteriota bacterium]|nr:hypothetical protein [Acidobacteriota bacterium]
MTPTFEVVLNQAQNLTPVEREKLIESLKQMAKENQSDKKREKIRAFRGKFKDILPSTKEFLAEKQKEMELENK